jgi:DHA1 family bicyclomycin/chloramphenicol resistance-like MFS transporter
MLLNVIYVLPESAELNNEYQYIQKRVAQEYWFIYKNKDFFVFYDPWFRHVSIAGMCMKAHRLYFIDFLGWTKTLCFGYISGGNAAGLIL